MSLLSKNVQFRPHRPWIIIVFLIWLSLTISVRGFANDKCSMFIADNASGSRVKCSQDDELATSFLASTSETLKPDQSALQRDNLINFEADDLSLNSQRRPKGDTRNTDKYSKAIVREPLPHVNARFASRLSSEFNDGDRSSSSSRLHENVPGKASVEQATTAGAGVGVVSARARARSLDDWDVENIVLLATVDGGLFARRRDTGERLWSFVSDRPMIETIYDNLTNSSSASEGTHHIQQRGTSYPIPIDAVDTLDSRAAAPLGLQPAVDKELETARTKSEQAFLNADRRKKAAAARRKRRYKNDYMWIVEPSQDGALYILAHGATDGLQKLGITVRQLAEELSPYSSEDSPFVYTAVKRNHLYTLNAMNGMPVKFFSASNEFCSGYKVGSETCLAEDSINMGIRSSSEHELNDARVILLGRTEYTISIQDGETGERICSIKYMEWTPNNRDRDLQLQYAESMDGRYIYSRYDGGVIALMHRSVASSDRKSMHIFNDKLNKLLGGTDSQGPGTTGKGEDRFLYHIKFSASPVVQVFDIARKASKLEGLTGSRITSERLVALTQPVGPSLHWKVKGELDTDAIAETNKIELIFVNRTEQGSWYALSEWNFPRVTDGATRAKWYTHPGGSSTEDTDGDDYNVQRNKRYGGHSDLIGIHALNLKAKSNVATRFPTLDAPMHKKIEEKNSLRSQDINDARQVKTWIHRRVNIVALCTCLVMILVTYFMHTNSHNISLTRLARGMDFLHTLLPTNHTKKNAPCEEVTDSKEPEKIKQETDGDGEGEKSTNSTVKKKKAHRGQRGGRRRRKNRDAAVSQAEESSPLPVVVVTPKRGITVNTTIKLQNLIIFTDKVLGYGSGGTVVYEGKFENRRVAVKRMLPQYFDLAIQEISLLQQSDDHPNVIRYFCFQKDENFLYIAVELCRASLWDIFHWYRYPWLAKPSSLSHTNANTSTQNSCSDDDQRLHNGEQAPDLFNEHSIIMEISNDVVNVLFQLASGLNHLHSMRILHRDIKPQNILISLSKRRFTPKCIDRKRQKDCHLRLLISDFGLCKTLPDNMSTLPTTGALTSPTTAFTTMNFGIGSLGWKAPELISHVSTGEAYMDLNHNNISNSSRVKRSADIFSLGCVFFYVLTQGHHPFDQAGSPEDSGNSTTLKSDSMASSRSCNVDDSVKPNFTTPPINLMREINIKTSSPNLSKLVNLGPDVQEAVHLVKWMLSYNPEKRPTSQQVLNHPFFWSPAQKLAFLCDVSDHWEREPRDPPSAHLKSLETFAPIVLQSTNSQHHMNFLACLHRSFIDTLSRQRKYSPDKLLDLLRALRNKKNHYADMPPDVQLRVGSLPDGYLAYWTTRFPRLLMSCWQAVVDCNLDDDPRFHPYLRAYT